MFEILPIQNLLTIQNVLILAIGVFSGGLFVTWLHQVDKKDINNFVRIADDEVEEDNKDEKDHKIITNRFETLYDADNYYYNIALIVDKETGHQYIFFADEMGGSVCELKSKDSVYTGLR